MNALPVARLFGFEIRVHVSWAIILAVIAVTAATQAAEVAPTIGSVGSWLVGGVIGLYFQPPGLKLLFRTLGLEPGAVDELGAGDRHRGCHFQLAFPGHRRNPS